MTAKKITPPALPPEIPASLVAPEAEAEKKRNFPIVGIGASAGGLAAFEAFFSGMPADVEPGMAFVLVQHLDPNHKSMLTELIKRYTRMQVYEVEDGMQVEPNCTYIIPPNADMAFLNGSLQLLEPAVPRGLRLPIDFFFRSLAMDQHERAICIVLSGTGSDGTLGLRAIKGEGGMAMAQSLDSTEYDGMPRSAIATGLVDYVLPPGEMAGQLIAYATHAYDLTGADVISLDGKKEGIYKKIFVILRAQTGHDFSLYKQNTITRRVERRMAVQQIQRLDDYMRFLQKTPVEVEALFRDLLIGVTNFFRDPAAFEVLREQAIPQLFAGKASGAAVRVWVPGCSSGEEPYSIAILMQEQMEALKQNFKLQVFATDIDSQAIEQARSGIYPASIAADIAPERLARFFTLQPDGASYRIQKGIRDILIFSEQDVIKDPPFSKLDMISCRNLLIYMGSELQKKLLPLFHYALNQGGYLFLGTSESIGDFSDLFNSIDRKMKLYQRKSDLYDAKRPSIGRVLGKFVLSEADAALSPILAEKKLLARAVSLRELTEQALLRHYSASGVLVNQRGEILYLHGRTGRYLEPVQGEAGLNILKMAREGLRRDLTSSLHKAVSHRELVSCPGLRVKTNGDFTTVHLTIRPVMPEPISGFEQNLFLVILEEAPEVDSNHAAVLHVSAGETASDVEERIATLKRELRSKEEYLQTANEELETANEELKSSNEEMQSVNEELQSTNEELETSKEELQSVNEELATVNAELQQKVTDLSRANNDIGNLLTSTGIGTIFVDYQLRIQRFTPSITQVINLIHGDVGRPVGHIVTNLVNYTRLVFDVQAVLESLIPREIEVLSQAGVWYLLRIQPYRTLENVIEGAVITFTDITEIKKAQAILQETEGMRRLVALVRDSNDAFMMLALDGRIQAWNPSAEKMYGWRESEALSMNLRELCPAGERKEALTVLRKLSESSMLEPQRVARISKDGQGFEAWLTATALFNADGEIYAISTTERRVNPADA